MEPEDHTPLTPQQQAMLHAAASPGQLELGDYEETKSNRVVL